LLFKKTGLSPRRFNILTPLPGSFLFEDSMKKGLLEDEDRYLEKVSKYEAGFASKKILVNLTDMNDDEFISLLNYAEDTMDANFNEFVKSKVAFWQVKLFLLVIVRYLIRATKIVKLSVWKRKVSTLFKRDELQKLTREQTERLYFQLK